MNIWSQCDIENPMLNDGDGGVVKLLRTVVASIAGN